MIVRWTATIEQNTKETNPNGKPKVCTCRVLQTSQAHPTRRRPAQERTGSSCEIWDPNKALVVALKSHNHKQSGLQSIYARPGNTVLQALGCFAVDMTPPFLRVHNGGKDLRFRLFGVTSGSQIQAEYVSTKTTASTSYKPSTPNHLKYDRSSYIPKTRQVAWGRLRRSPLPVPAGKAFWAELRSQPKLKPDNPRSKPPTARRLNLRT